MEMTFIIGTRNTSQTERLEAQPAHLSERKKKFIDSPQPFVCLPIGGVGCDARLQDMEERGAAVWGVLPFQGVSPVLGGCGEEPRGPAAELRRPV